MLLKEITAAIEERVSQVLRNGTLTKYLDENQQALASELAAELEQEFCLLASSGTAALEVGLRALGIKPGDRVVLSGYDYPGNFWAIERTGAMPVLIDTQPDGWSIDLDQLRDVFRSDISAKAVVISHLHGQSQDVRRIAGICHEFDRPWIEDCCQSIGGQRSDTRLGTLADMSVVSFGGGKLLSAGRGGALLTNSATAYQKAKLASGAGSGPYGLSEIQAAIVSAQLPFQSRLNEDCCAYFAKVNEHLCAHGQDISMPAASEVASKIASLYQVGWLPGQEQRSDREWNVQTRLARLGQEDCEAEFKHGFLSLGVGFSGFHRRSSRRCVKPFQLTQVKRISEQTLVAHHRLALEKKVSEATLADLIGRVLNPPA